MLNAEDEKCERKNVASDFGENGNEIFSAAKVGGFCGNSSGEHPGRGSQCNGLECPSTFVSAVDYVVQMKGVKKQDAEE